MASRFQLVILASENICRISAQDFCRQVVRQSRLVLLMPFKDLTRRLAAKRQVINFKYFRSRV